MLQRFFRVKENILVFKTHWATRGAVNFYSAGVVTRDGSIGSWSFSRLWLGVLIRYIHIATVCLSVG
jgi:hypothetical protein